MCSVLKQFPHVPCAGVQYVVESTYAHLIKVKYKSMLLICVPARALQGVSNFLRESVWRHSCMLQRNA